MYVRQGLPYLNLLEHIQNLGKAQERCVGVKTPSGHIRLRDQNSEGPSSFTVKRLPLRLQVAVRISLGHSPNMYGHRFSITHSVTACTV